MRLLAAPALAALAGTNAVIVQLVYMGFAPSPLTLNASNFDFLYGGLLYKGAGILGTVAEVQDSPGEVKGISFELSGVSTEAIAVALDDAAVVQGTPCLIRTALLNAAYQIVDAPIDWIGTLDTMSISEDGDTCTIAVTAESSAVDLLRGSPLTYSDADQKALFPGDRGFEFVLSQVDAPIIWPHRQWFIDKGKR